MRTREIMFLIVGAMAIAILCVGGPALAAEPVSAEATRYFSRGLAAAEMARSTEDYAEAARELEKARQLAPQWPEVYYKLGLLHEKAGNYDGAIENFSGYLRLAPASPEAARIQETIYRLEYKRDRNDLKGIWKTDVNETTATCNPPSYQVGRGSWLSSGFVIDDLVLEFSKNPEGERVRVLSSKHRFGLWLPDGPFVPVKREGELVAIYGAVMHVCSDAVQNDHCPWKGTFSLNHKSVDVLEGTLDVKGAGWQRVSWTKQKDEFTFFQCTGKIVMRRISKQ